MLISSLRANSRIRIIASFRRRAPAVPLALAVGMGQVSVWFLGASLWIALLVGVLGCGVLLKRLRGYSWLICGVLAGLISAYLALRPDSPTHPFNGDISVFGTIDGVPRHPRPGEITFELRVSDAARGDLIRCRAIELPWRNAAHLKPGDAVWVRGEFSQLAKPINPFSWVGWLWRRGVTAECKARFVSVPAFSNTPFLYRLREGLRERVFSAIGDSAGGALLLSMALGYHDLLSVPLEKAFTRLGLTHLLVVSGYQVSLMFGFVLACSARLIGTLNYGSRHLRSLMSVGAFVFAAIYVVFIGAEMSAVRALLAASCACAHLLSERETSFAQRWGLALLGMELIWPWSVFDIGVALTFAALLGIGLGSDIAGKSKVAQTFWVTFIVWLCTSMIIVAWQGTVSPVGLILNLAIAAPWSVINCVVGLCALSLSFIPLPGALYPLKLVALINQTLSDIVLYIGESSFGGWQVEGLVRIFVLLLLAAALALVLRLTVRKKRVRT